MTNQDDIYKKKMWARGLTATDYGKNVDFGSGPVLLRSVEHLGNTTIATVVTVVEVPSNREIRVYD